jgi:galactose mutarotase-like enzyme
MSSHSISNTQISISVNSLGAELISLKKNEKEFLWQSDKNVWARYAPVLFPIVGKLKNNEYLFDNTAYNLPQHGFARDSEFTLIAQNKTSLEFEITADENTLKIYPFHFSLRILYELNENSLTIKYKVFNPDKKDLLFSIGAHPGFNCKSLNDNYLEFENKNELTAEKLKDGLLSGETYKLKLENGRLQLSTELFDNDALVFKNTQIEKVALCSTKTKEKIILTCKNWPYFGIWTKKGSDAFVCLEPWYGIADSVNSSGELVKKEGIVKIGPYKYFNTEFELALS